MKRRNSVVWSVGLSLAVLLAPAMAQESSRPASLAERLNALRLGWRNSISKSESTPAGSASQQPTRQSSQTAPQRQTLEQPRIAARTKPPQRVASLAPLQGARVPRLDPRDLLPRDFKGPSVEKQQASRLPAEAVGVDTAPPESGRSSALGSVRSRILRDLRQQGDTTFADELLSVDESKAAANATRRKLATQKAGRAGSVLSGNPSPMGQFRERIAAEARSGEFLRQSGLGEQVREQARTQAADKQAISKSIAADVAQQLSTSPSEPTADEAEQQAALAAAAAPKSDAVSQSNAVPETNTVAEALPAAPVTPEPAVETPAVATTVAEPVASSAIVPATPAIVVEATPAEATPAEPMVAQARGPITIRPSAAPQRIAIETTPAPRVEPKQDFRVQAFANDRGSSFSRQPNHENQQASRDSTFGRSSLRPNRDNVLITQATPQLSAQVLGPRKVVIGRPAKFQVQMQNRGAATAKSLETRVDIPEWAEVESITSTAGIVDSETLSQSGYVLWRMDRFAPNAQATMDMTLIARSGQPIELAVDWKHAPIASRALVEVQEPKLAMDISGPDEVFFGKAQLFRLTLSNPGTGVAEGVSLLLAPPGKPLEQATRHALGDLAPGASKSIEIELTAREAGQLALAARANATGGVEASIDKQVFCRKAEIVADWRGPEQKYTNAPSTYYFRVRNSGTASAAGVTFDVTLPEGFEMTSASEGQSYDSRRRLLSWRVGELRPGDDYYMELKGISRTAGDKDFRVQASTGDQLVSDSLNAVTRVVAVADLKLDVRDPKGPLPVGADAVYEVRVRNRGSNVAKSVDVIALFSGGIEPYSVEGRQCRISDGRVSLPTIERLPAGEEIVLRIHARAVEPGTHVFRAEAACRDLEIRLAAEEMTRFYADDSLLDDDARSAAAADRFNQPR